MEIRVVHPYSGGARTVAKLMKDATNDNVLNDVSSEMARLVPSNSIIVPTPSSSGENKAMLVLATKIAALVPGAESVEAVVRTYPVESSHLRRKAGKKALTVDEHVASMALAHKIQPDRLVVVIDNVIVEGNTINAVEHILGVHVVAVVYAKPSRSAPIENPPKTLTVCISGSRTYGSLYKIEQVLSTIPRSSTIIHGGAEGVDSYAGIMAERMGFDVRCFPANWKKMGKSAGVVRTKAMIASCDMLYVFWNGISRGAAHAISIARKSQKDYEVITE